MWASIHLYSPVWVIEQSLLIFLPVPSSCPISHCISLFLVSSEYGISCRKLCQGLEMYLNKSLNNHRKYKVFSSDYQCTHNKTGLNTVLELLHFHHSKLEMNGIFPILIKALWARLGECSPSSNYCKQGNRLSNHCTNTFVWSYMGPCIGTRWSLGRAKQTPY